MTTEACILKASAVDGQPLAQRFIGDRVVEKACAQTSPFFADRQRQEPFLAQAVVVLDGMAGLAIVRRRPGTEIGGQLAAFVL
jgi:hypothetical protein